MLQVRDFTFSPDDGRIDSIKFDRYGVPAVPDSLFSVYGLSVWDVLRVDSSRLLVRSSLQISKETDGLLDRATEALFALRVPLQHLEQFEFPDKAWDESRDDAMLDDKAFSRLPLRRALMIRRTISCNTRSGTGCTVPHIVHSMAR